MRASKLLPTCTRELGILQHLLGQILRIRDGDVGQRSSATEHRFELRLYEPRIGREVQRIDAPHDLIPQLGIEMNPVGLENCRAAR